MKRHLLLLVLLFAAGFLHAQDITGIWRGYFNSGYGYYKQQYKYEIQINQLANKAAQKSIQGVTYSYHTTVFYGKATLQGIYDAKNKSLTFNELKLVELKISDKSEPCLMSCYLDYSKEDKTEILRGTFISVNEKSKKDCGSGYVYLEKVTESDFEKEDFLVKKKPLVKPPVTILPKDNNPIVQKKQVPEKKPEVGINQKKTVTAPPVNPRQTGVDTIAIKKPFVPKPAEEDRINKELTKKILPVPEVIKTRDNPLIKSIITNSSDILIQLYDNGEIDGDTITVFDNNEIIVNKKGLTKQPITINLTSDIQNAHHEIVMVANNLGTIAPNTALMIITTGNKRYELFISSDERKNARVIIDFKMPGKDTK
ncbi:hypothetical protein [Limnovirga soli]|uniref:Uncharacterized protein n=1 Tax=Limnovirga soli TaxID=2656915 RepID=A0A8J8JUR4_9BACT|nr:hypothetical protein [Limnovirga soli]NNV55849.1 hypothetical protein [Limnovirga soli]